LTKEDVKRLLMVMDFTKIEMKKNTAATDDTESIVDRVCERGVRTTIENRLA